MVEIVELRVRVPKNEHAYSRSHLSFFNLYLTSHQTGGVLFFQKERDHLSDDVKEIFRIAEFNLDALSTVDLGPKRPFGVNECALKARLAGPRFAAQVATVVSLVEAPSNCGKSIAVAKEIMAIRHGNTTGNSIKKFFESPFAGKHPELISNGAKAAAAAETAEADLEEAKYLAAEFKALGGGALTIALAQDAEPRDPLRECWLVHERLRCRRQTRPIARKS
jgi:hypothetical protein